MKCGERQAAATERRLQAAPGPASEEHALHVRTCAACGAHDRFLEELVATLDAEPRPALNPAVMERATRRAQRVVRAQRSSPELGRKIWVALSLSLLVLPVIAGHAYLVTQGASALLEPWLPGPLLVWMGVAYFGSLALALGALYGSIPLAVALGRRGTAELA